MPNSLVKVSFDLGIPLPRNVAACSSLRGCESLICTYPSTHCFTSEVCVQSVSLCIILFASFCYVNNVENCRQLERNSMDTTLKRYRSFVEYFPKFIFIFQRVVPFLNGISQDTLEQRSCWKIQREDNHRKIYQIIKVFIQLISKVRTMNRFFLYSII